MQAVILAGGLGTRLRPITEKIPKPMVEVGGEPFLARIVRWLVQYGFRRQLFLLGYRGEIVSDYFGNGSKFGAEVTYSQEPQPLGTAGALRLALDKLEEEFLVLYGDSYLPIDYREVEAEFHRVPCDGLLVVFDNRVAHTGVINNVAIANDGCVTRYAKGAPAQDLKFVEAGVLCFRREVFADVPPGASISLEQEVYPVLIEKKKLRAFVTRQRFFDIGTPQRLEEFSSTQ